MFCYIGADAIISTILVAVPKKFLTRSLASSSLQLVAANPSPAASKSALGYKDFNIVRARLDAFNMMVCTASRDRVSRESSCSGPHQSF
jgi:hypothetical protein